jgi:hypothetical protein
VDAEAAMITVDVVRVADVSQDLRNITRIYPVDTIDTWIRIPVHGSPTMLQDISAHLCFLNGVNDSIKCDNSGWNRADWLP